MISLACVRIAGSGYECLGENGLLVFTENESLAPGSLFPASLHFTRNHFLSLWCEMGQDVCNCPHVDLGLGKLCIWGRGEQARLWRSLPADLVPGCSFLCLKGQRPPFKGRAVPRTQSLHSCSVPGAALRVSNDLGSHQWHVGQGERGRLLMVG